MTSVASTDDFSGSIRAFSRKNRVFIFREFLLRTYGKYLAKNSTILDVAGGKGDLSWLLANVDDMDSIVVDPRVTKHSHLIRSIEYLRSHPEEASQRAIPGLPTYQPLATLMPQLELKASNDFVKPRHLRLLVDQDLVDAVAHYLKTMSKQDWHEYWLRASNKALQAQPLGYKEPSHSSVNQIIRADVALDAILSVRLVVGFHPDQAAEACVDLAMLLDIPFCIVPCCVFPSEFPERRNADGTRLRTYHQLLEHLARKSDDISRADLPFPFTDSAKNRVLYTVPRTRS